MCFYVRQSKEAQEVRHRFHAKIENEALFRPQNFINGFTFPKTPVIANDKPDFIRHFQWGLIPYWAKDDSIKKFTLNAKIETIHEKPSYRDSVNKRCLVIVDGFFEWKWLDPKGKSKQKYLITFPGDALFALGGIWSEWANKETGEIVKSFSIVTTEANALMSEIHNSQKRMPVILTQQNEQDWLAGKPFDEFKTIDVELIASAI